MDTAPRVKLNVGGKMFEVYRSLIERYPDILLAKAVGIQSDEQEDDISNVKTTASKPDEVIFFDRDGDRFGSILDYMRDGKVTIPFWTKEALMEDLCYFGFHQIDTNLIQTNLSVVEMRKGMKFFQLQSKKDLDEYEEKQLAYYCMLEYINDGTIYKKIQS